MGTINHKIRPGYDIDLAIIEGTKVVAFCGDTFVPTVTVGTSGRADVPGAPECEFCKEARNISIAWSRAKDEKNRLIREMRALEKAHASVIQERRERARKPQRESQPA